MSIFFDFPEDGIDYRKNQFKIHMDFLKNMPVEENVFYKKFSEVQTYARFLNKSSVVKAKIWTPTDITTLDTTVQEIKSIKPEVVFVDPTNAALMEDWLMLRVFCHTMAYDQNPGRFLRFLIKDANTDTYLGATSVVSDVVALGGRDEFIGWTSEDRLKKNKLCHSAIGSCIMPTQPFGYNFIGGKLVACLTAGETVKEVWKRLYGETLVGMTTTSLYGAGSMYDGMDKYWKGLGESTGKIAIKPDDGMYDEWHQYVKKEYAEEYEQKMTQKEGVNGPVTGAKQRIMQMIFKATDVKSGDYQHGYKRGVYYAMMYENGKEFMKSNLQESELKMKPQWKNDSDIISWWREKAIRRYIKLHQENKLKNDILFYNDVIGMTYEQAKTKYFKDVGR